MNQSQPPVAGVHSPDIVINDGSQVIRVGQGAKRAQLNALAETRQALESARQTLQAELQKMPNPAARAQMAEQIAQIDQQIASVDQTIAGTEADQSPEPWQVISAPPTYTGPARALPKDIFALSGFFIVCVLGPLSIALALRIVKRGAAKVAQLPSDLAERLGRIETAIESTAIEVERIGEGQRYLTRVLGDKKTEDLLERPRPVAPYRVITPH